MPYSVDTAIEKSVMPDVTPSFETIVLPIQHTSDNMCTSSYVERGFLKLGTEDLPYGTRMIGNPATHVAGFTRMPTCAGDHWYIAKN
jgi:hypothetical protein